MSETEHPKPPNDSKAPAVEAQEAAFAGPDASLPQQPEAAPPPPSPPGLDDQLTQAREEAAAAQDRYLRTLADLENFRRRTLREKDDLRAYAAARAVEELLPVLDNLALGLVAAKAPNADVATLLNGFEMVGNQLRSALANQGLKEINPVGQAFDPNLHEAISQQPSADTPEGQVLQVVRVGYMLNGRLLRPASVVVSGGPSTGEAKG